MDIDHIIEKTMLINAPKHGKWSPDMSMLMHVASFDDEGGHPDFYKENSAEMIKDGQRPQRVRVKLAVSVEYLDDPITGQPS